MNILITGRSGFIGGHLGNKLSQSHNVIGFSRHRVTNTDVEGDVTDFFRVLEVIGDHDIDQIYHCAAKSVVRNCRTDPINCFKTNVMGTLNVLEAARQSERVQGVMCMESDKSYGSGQVPYQEDQVLLPGSIYEASKASVAHLVRTYWLNYHLPVFSIRSANVYGPNDPNMSRLVPNTITRLTRGEQPQITAGANDFLREFVYVKDVTHCLTHLMALGPWGEAINVGSGWISTVASMITTICELMGRPFEYEEWEKPKTLSEIGEQSLNLTKLQSLLPDYEPSSIEEGLKYCIEWYCNQ